MSTNLEHQITLLKDAAFESSRFMLRDFNEVMQLQNSTKGVDDFVNKCYNRIGRRLCDYLYEKRPKYPAIAVNDKVPDAEYYFVVEPIAGIENFKHGVSFCACAIALFQKNNDNALAVIIYNPLLREAFYAANGFGAWFENYTESLAPKSRMRVTSKKNGQPFFRDLGNPLLEMAYFAAGRFDIISGKADNLISKAALILLKEAGAIVNLKDDNFSCP